MTGKRVARPGGVGLRGPKSYKEIQAENRRRPIKGGWRGQKVLGGGAAISIMARPIAP